MSQEFEWDEIKRLSNIEKLGIDFEDTIEVFDGRPAATVLRAFQADKESSRQQPSTTDT
jgi:uncharacterized DUF497 family protein